jgi:SNF2 family DNA or RNA helicase
MSVKWTYKIDDFVPGAPSQAVGYSDRPLSAFTAALASWQRGNQLRGAANGLSDDEISAEALAVYKRAGVPEARAGLWLASINGIACPMIPYGWTPEHAPFTASNYQIDALNRTAIGGGVLGMRVGLGKTPTAATFACWLAHKKIVDQRYCLIVAPLNAFGAWDKWMPALKHYYTEVQVMSVDSAHKAVGLPNRGGMLIVDEGHALGDMKARRTQAMHSIRPLFDSCLVLTGTFLHAGVEKTLSMLDLAVPGYAQFSSRWKCGEHFHVLIKQKFGSRTTTSLAKPTVTRPQFMEYLSRYVVMLDKDSPGVEEAGIPEQELTTIPVGAPWLPLHAEAAALAIALTDADGLPHASEVMHALARAGIEAKLNEWATTQGMLMLDPATGKHTVREPCVLFAHYTETLDAIAKFLGEHGIPFVRVDGSTKVAERKEAQRKFQAGEVDVFLGQTTAAGIAIDLFRARMSATFDASFKAIDYAQALGRTARRGSTFETVYHADFVANALQRAIIERVREAADFNASAVEYQDIKRTLALKGIT